MGETKEKKLKAKVVHKHETAADWELSNYIPDVGEIVFYDPDEEYGYTRQKNGDGVLKVHELPFSTEEKLDANGWTSSKNGELSFEKDVSQDEWSPETKSINIGANGINIHHEVMVQGADNGNSVRLGANGIRVYNHESSAHIDIGDFDFGSADQFIKIYNYGGTDTKYRWDGIEVDSNKLTFPEKAGTLALQEDVTEALDEVENTKQDKLPANLFSAPVVWGPNNKNNKCLIGRFFIKGNYKAVAINNNKLNITSIDGISFKLGTSADYVRPSNELGYAILFNIARMFTMADGKYAEYISTESTYSTSAGETTIAFYWTYPYYIKRISAEEGTNGTSAGPDTGIVTTETYFKKWREGIINTAGIDKIGAYQEYLLKFYIWNVVQEGNSGSILDAAPTLATENTPKFQLTAVTENREAFSHTLAARNGLGQLIVNDATGSFQAVNKRQLDREIQTVSDDINSVNIALTNNINNVNTTLNTRINTKTAFRHNDKVTIKYLDSFGGPFKPGDWIKVATGGGGHSSQLFNLHITGSIVTLCTFIVDSHESNGENTTIEILSVTNRDYNASTDTCMIDKIAVVVDSGVKSIYVRLAKGSRIDSTTLSGNKHSVYSLNIVGTTMALTPTISWQLLSKNFSKVPNSEPTSDEISAYTDQVNAIKSEIMCNPLPQGATIYAVDVYPLPKIRVVDSLPDVAERRADTLYFSKS